jgi:hypothetical protein
MTNRLMILITVALATLSFAVIVMAYAAPPQRPGAANDQKAAPPAAPAPIHDLSGLWDPTPAGAGIQAQGPLNMRNDGKPEHELPYTPYGMKVYKSHKPLEGPIAVAPGLDNDPRNLCEPLGFPRMNWYNLWSTQIVQTEGKVLILYQYDQRWREVVMNQELPKDLLDSERRFYGYSVGKWADDTTLVVQTTGMMPEARVWLDSTGRPLSDQLRVEERFHRVNHDRLELTVTIDDPKMYTKPWIAMDKFAFKLLPPDTRVLEMLCSPVDQDKYNKEIGNSVNGTAGK